MPSPEIWSKSVPTVELDQRSREARIRFESIERLLVPRAGVTHSGIRRFLALHRVGVSDHTSASNTHSSAAEQSAAFPRPDSSKGLARGGSVLDASGRRAVSDTGSAGGAAQSPTTDGLVPQHRDPRRPSR
jgi:hypothetical protein